MLEGENNFTNFAEEGTPVQDQINHHNEQLDMPGVVRSGSSSPSVPDMATEGPPLSPADKKRNKLGYHRTAVACGHCRRRKIRCIPAFDDQSGRCQNCIRLKKDCHFFPVDLQTSGGRKRARSVTRTSDGFLNEGDTSVASSSPGGILGSTSMEQTSHADGPLDTPPLSRESPSLHGYHPSRSMSVQGLDFSRSLYASQQLQQHQQILVQSPYSPRSYGSTPMNSQLYQQQYGHSQPAQYASPFTTGGLPTTMTMLPQENTYGYQTPVSNGSYNWSQPTRSISSDASEEISSGFPTPYRTNTYPSFERRMTGQMHQTPSASSSSIPTGMESQQNVTHGQFHEPNSYHSMQMGMQHEWVGSGPASAQQVSSSGVNSYTQSWYQPHPSVPEMKQGEGQPQMLPSHSHDFTRSQHKPG